MKICDIITESVDQNAADELLRGLIASGDPSAKYFQMTRFDSRYKSVESAMRAADITTKRAAEQDRKRVSTKQPTTNSPASASKPKISSPTPQPDIQSADQTPRNYSDRFYGNQHTGSLGKSHRYDDYGYGKLTGMLGIKPNSTIGRAISTAKSVTKPLTAIKHAFQLGTSLAPTRR